MTRTADKGYMFEKQPGAGASLAKMTNASVPRVRGQQGSLTTGFEIASAAQVTHTHAPIIESAREERTHL